LQAGGDALVLVRKAVVGVEQALVAHELGEIISLAVLMVEGHSHSPDVATVGAGEQLFAERLRLCNSRYITISGRYPNQNSPTDFASEAGT
jgi:hypothetical protein